MRISGFEVYKMKILAIDTSTDHLSLAVLDGDHAIARIHKKAPMSHSKLLVPMIDKLLKKAGLEPKDIDAFAIGIGPGSFTGLRIGVATVKGLAYALEKPIIAVPTLDAIAQNAKSFKGIICPVLDAKKDKFYASLYRSDGKIVKRISRYLLLAAKDLMEKVAGYDKILFLGDAVTKNKISNPDWHQKSDWKRFMFKLRWHPRAEVVAALALDKKTKHTAPEDLEPMYLYSRECDIKGI